MTDPMAGLREAMRVIGEAQRVIVVPPELEEAAQGVVDASPFPGLYRVMTNPHLAANRAYVMPESAGMVGHPAPTSR